MAGKFTALQPTPQMQKFSLSFPSVEGYARSAVKLIQEHGTEFLDMIDAGFRGLSAVTGHDFPALFVALNDVNRNASNIIAAIQAEFGV